MKQGIITNIQNLRFNSATPATMHIDINSCFATVEQQFNPKLRGLPIAVAVSDYKHACIVAPSIESKKLGVKTGMRVSDAKKIIPDVKVLVADPPKYRLIHNKMRKLLEDYTAELEPKSIDEFVLHLRDYPAYKQGIKNTAKEIKERIRKEVGEWISVSIGIGANRFLAKTAAGLVKPDGLEEINSTNYMDRYQRLQLTDLYGISSRNMIRLNAAKIFTIPDFYYAKLVTLQSAFKSIAAYYWYLRLRGWEIDDYKTHRGSFSHSYVVPKPVTTDQEIAPILQKLVEKLGHRLRQKGYSAQHIHFGLKYADHTYWHLGKNPGRDIFESTEIYREAMRICMRRPYKKPVCRIDIGCSDLKINSYLQLDLFNQIEKQDRFSKTLDKINEEWGDFTLHPARMLHTGDIAPDRIAFGK